ncbi:hypothetical protein ACVIVD_005812 [Bradyrhizobium liaoningense]
MCIAGRDPDRDAFGIAQRHLFRHQLADDEGGVGDERDHEPDPDDVGNALGEAELEQPLRQPLSERCARECAGEHTDQRDADLHRRQELAGIGGQRQRPLGAAHALGRQQRQPRRTRRDHGQFGHGEQAVDDDQDDDDDEFEREH